MTKKDIIDVCCGGRMFWFNKKHENVIYMDKFPKEKGIIKQQSNWECNPDIIGDFTNILFENESFSIVIFDPPHIKQKNESIITTKYGYIESINDIIKGFDECMRILKINGVLIFKWSEVKYSISDILKLIPYKPLIGHTTGKSGKTKWCIFRKEKVQP